MIVVDHMRMARNSIKANQLRSVLTMLGVIIGVAAVVTIIGIGDGLKKQIDRQSDTITKNMISVRPGRTVERDQSGAVVKVNVLPTSFASGSITLNDANEIASIDGVDKVVSMSMVSGLVKYNDKEFKNPNVIATKSDFSGAISQKVEYGSFYGEVTENQRVAVIGKGVAEDIFGELVPIGKSFTFRDQTFLVKGVFEQFPVAPLTQNVNYNDAIFIPDNVASNLAGSKPQLYEIMVGVRGGYDKQSIVRAIDNRLITAHGGQEDFTVLRSDEMSLLTSKTFSLISGMTILVAIISLLVGGIGIMNVMLVTVSERSREIGIRKALGASNKQIRWQFLIESMVISFWGSVIGVILAGVIMLALRVFTHLEPTINPAVIVFSMLGAVCIGVLFGVAPAQKASRKNPIDALRSM